MERGKISISEKKITISTENGEIWLSAYEIARLFEVFVAKVTGNIKTILKSGVLCERDVCYCHHYENGNSMDLYNLEMITALAFRIHSPNADRFRAWLIKRACSKSFSLVEELCDERKISLN